MLKFARSLAIAALLTSAAPALAATNLTFTLSGTNSATFDLASDAPFYNATTGGYSSAIFTNVSGVFAGVARTEDFAVFDAASGGGFQLTFMSTFVSDLGPVIYQGTLTHPTFTPGTYHFTAGFGVGAVDDTLTISDGSVQAAVPEPSVWALLLVGMLCLGAALRRDAASRGPSAAAI